MNDRQIASELIKIAGLFSSGYNEKKVGKMVIRAMNFAEYLPQYSKGGDYAFRVSGRQERHSFGMAIEALEKMLKKEKVSMVELSDFVVKGKGQDPYSFVILVDKLTDAMNNSKGE